MSLYRLPLRSLAFVVLLVAGGASLAATPPITLPDGRTVQLSAKAIESLPRLSVSATAHGKTARYGGYDLRQVLEAAGVRASALRGRAMTTIVTVSAPDGYHAVFALAELDPTLGNRQVLLADRENGQPLPPATGPWRLVVPADQRPARWVRQVNAIAVSNPQAARTDQGPRSATAAAAH
ncbi:molybdopterin-dependent oxidoreductase [Rhodanobacter sp. Si-c]|uniref:Molybdopterin-dependent oxidoreductase n=1 Tax=Rhodanobacter lycopersici TaxID=3162487 RepID=A0ABV3QCV6_9GAMM